MHETGLGRLARRYRMDCLAYVFTHRKEEEEKDVFDIANEPDDDVARDSSTAMPET